MIYRVPELAIMNARETLQQNLPLLDPKIAEFIKPLVGSTEGPILDIMSGLGVVAEALSESGCDVRLLEEQRLFFVYRKQLWPNSKVIEMNIHPSVFKTNKKIFYASIIQNDEFLEFAKSVSRFVYNVGNFTVTSSFIYEATINNTENNTDLTENKNTEQTTAEES